MKVIFIIHAIVALIFGLAFVFVPGSTLSLYGVTVNEAGIFISRLYGASLLVFAVLAWFARNAEESTARRAILIGFFIGFAVGFIVALIGQLSGVVNAVGWSAVSHWSKAAKYGCSSSARSKPSVPRTGILFRHWPSPMLERMMS